MWARTNHSRQTHGCNNSSYILGVFCLDVHVERTSSSSTQKKNKNTEYLRMYGGQAGWDTNSLNSLAVSNPSISHIARILPSVDGVSNLMILLRHTHVCSNRHLSPGMDAALPAPLLFANATTISEENRRLNKEDTRRYKQGRHKKIQTRKAHAHPASRHPPVYDEEKDGDLHTQAYSVTQTALNNHHKKELRRPHLIRFSTVNNSSKEQRSKRDLHNKAEYYFALLLACGAKAVFLHKNVQQRHETPILPLQDKITETSRRKSLTLSIRPAWLATTSTT